MIQPARKTYTGIVDEHVRHDAFGTAGTRNNATALFGREIGGHRRQKHVSSVFHRASQRAIVEVRQNELAARVAKLAGHVLAEATTGTGDEYGFFA